MTIRKNEDGNNKIKNIRKTEILKLRLRERYNCRERRIKIEIERERRKKREKEKNNKVILRKHNEDMKTKILKAK